MDFVVGFFNIGGGGGGRLVVRYIVDEWIGFFEVYGGIFISGYGGVGIIYIESGLKIKIIIVNKEVFIIKVSLVIFKYCMKEKF